MNEPFDPLEAELAALEPRRPSAEMAQRIAERVERDASGKAAASPRLARRILTAITSGTVAASLLLALFLRRERHDPPVAPPDRLQPPLTAAFDPSLPSVWTYHRAVSAAPADIDALLDKHASAAAEPARRELHVSAFPMGSSDLKSFLGEL